MARSSDLSLALMTLLPCLLLCTSASVELDCDNYVREACGVTRYPDLCIHTLSSFSSSAKRSPSLWARAGVSVTTGAAKSLAQYLAKLENTGAMRGRSNLAALSDCVECFQDAVDNLHRSLGVLRQLHGPSFYSQMDDVTTWLSAALTDEDTCLDGFEGQRGRQVKVLRDKVTNVSCITSNALALVHKLATTGPQTLAS
ncbi:pectinesterase inhibitor 6-like [Diospyros lotus]|uniref:pectinesterase inhibitor 6-like n=1 Tax=Diospyros lotus TaxID=55363 RepID=UPI0022518879|nr:pectinesterase inhibitor 6-like [Diospyros lotus]